MEFVTCFNQFGKPRSERQAGKRCFKGKTFAFFTKFSNMVKHDCTGFQSDQFRTESRQSKCNSIGINKFNHSKRFAEQGWSRGCLARTVWTSQNNDIWIYCCHKFYRNFQYITYTLAGIYTIWTKKFRPIRPHPDPLPKGEETMK